MAEEQEDCRLVEAARRKDRAAFGELARRHRHTLVGLAARLLGDRHQAEDVAQDALTVALQRLDSLQEPLKFRAWLTAILVNLCRNRARREAPVSLRFQPEDRRDSREQEAMGAVLAEAAQRLLSLPPRQASTAVLFYFYGHSYREIADILSLTPTAVQSAVQRARDHLRSVKADIRTGAQRKMENHTTDLEHVAETPNLVLRRLRLGEPRWGGMNQLELTTVNRSDHPIYLGIEIGAHIPDTPIGCVAQSTWELAPREERTQKRSYLIPHLYSPWFAAFRGPGAARIRVTVARLSAEEHKGSFETRGRATESIIFQRAFDVIVPADPERQAEPVKPVLPKVGDVTLVRAEHEPLGPQGVRARVLLRNHTAETRKVVVNLARNGSGAGHRDVDLPPDIETWVDFEHKGPSRHEDAAKQEQPRYRIHVEQMPLNLRDLDIEQPIFFFMDKYVQQVPEARVATVELDLDQ